MQIPTGQVAPSPSTIQAIGSTQSPGIAEGPERSAPQPSARDIAPDQQVARAEAPAAPRESAPATSGPPRSLPRGSVVDLKV